MQESTCLQVAYTSDYECQHPDQQLKQFIYMLNCKNCCYVRLAISQLGRHISTM